MKLKSTAYKLVPHVSLPTAVSLIISTILGESEPANERCSRCHFSSAVAFPETPGPPARPGINNLISSTQRLVVDAIIIPANKPSSYKLL